MTRNTPPVPEGVDSGKFAWSMMSNMTHPNWVIDLIMEAQPEHHENMNRLQLMCVGSAISGVANICTILAERAQLPDSQAQAVNAAFRQPYFTMATLMGMRRD